MKFDIPVIATVECNTIEEARQLAYKAIESVNDSIAIEFSMADDSNTDRNNNRIVFLHPEDAHAEFSPEEYERSKEGSTDQEENQE